MTYRLTIPAWHPTPTNRLLGCHHITAARRKKSDRNLVCGYAILHRFPPATGKRELKVTIQLGPRQRGCDPDAYHKSLCDALVHAKLLVDDSRRWVRLLPVEFVRGEERATTIELREI